jgi:nucleoside-diphosphate-sugar epimerase
LQVAITGATGFIGRHLMTRHLSAGDDVRYLTRKNIEVDSRAQMFHGDLTSVDVLQEFLEGVDVLYHCAAELQNESKMYATNVIGTRNLIEAAKGRIGRWVQLSSTGVYGKPQDEIVEEYSPLNPGSYYEVTKLESDRLVLEATAKGKLSSIVVRPSNVYGPHMINQSLFRLVTMVNRGLFFYIGKPGALANYIHVENVVDALVLCARSKNLNSGSIYIVSDQCTIESFVNDIAITLNVKPPRFRMPKYLVRATVSVLALIPGFPLTMSRIDALTSQAFYSTKLIRKDLGYRPRISIKEGVSELVGSQKDKQDQIV